MARSPRSPWPEPGADEQPPVCVEMAVPRWVRWALITLGVLAVISLAVNVLTVVYATDVNRQLDETADYIAGRGVQRDAENDRLNERIDRAVCTLLDRLPAGDLFDPAREEYGCGPGIPLDQLDPGASQNLADILGATDEQAGRSTAAPTSTPVPTSAPDEMPPGAPPGARPSPMGQAPTTTAAPTTAPLTPAPTAAAPTTPPLVDLTPLTDPLCTLIGVCTSP